MFFNPLYHNAPKALIIPRKFTSAYYFDSISGIEGAFDNLVKDTYNSAVGYLGESCRNKTEKQCHRTFSNLILKGKWREAVWFIYGREKGGFLQPDELSWYRTYTINKTVELVLEGEHQSKKKPPVLFRNVRGDTYVHSRQHHGRSHKISST